MALQALGLPSRPHHSNGVALTMYYVILGAALVALIVVFFVVRKKGE